MGELLKCTAAGFAGLASLALILWLSYVLLPYSAYFFGGVFFLGICAALGSDLRSGRAPR
jgi:hypothetical protein